MTLHAEKIAGPLVASANGIKERLDAAYDGRCFLPIPKVAAMLEMSEKTLRRHVQTGRIVATTLGSGRVRPRCRFTREQVDQFLDVCTRKAPGTLEPKVLADIHEQARRHARAKLDKTRRAGSR